jgi:hypothetical protein
MGGQSQHTLSHTHTRSNAFPVEEFVIEVDPEDFFSEENYSSKPIAQTKSKFASPFGAQIATPCTYGVY